MNYLKIVIILSMVSSFSCVYSMQTENSFKEILLNAQREIDQNKGDEAQKLLNPLAHWLPVDTRDGMIARKNALEMLMIIAKKENKNGALMMLQDKYKEAEKEGSIRFNLFIGGEDI
jgi:hypothetical protein